MSSSSDESRNSDEEINVRSQEVDDILNSYVERVVKSYVSSAAQEISEQLSPERNAFSNVRPETFSNKRTYSDLYEKELLSLTERNDYRAISALGCFYFKQELFRMAERFLKKCPEWDYKAQYFLGIIYFDGLEVPQNQELGVVYMRQVAEANPKKSKISSIIIHSAQYMLGLAYYQGFGIPRDEEEAIKWWTLSANNGQPDGNIDAQTVLGLYFSDTLHKNLEIASEWYEAAMKNGNIHAQAAYGVMCQSGLGVKNDFQRALYSLKQSCKDPTYFFSSGNLVELYYKRKMYTLAVQLAKRLVHKGKTQAGHLSETELKGLALACFYLGRCYQLGLGIEKDMECATECFHQAIAYDIEVAHPLYLNMICGLI